MKQAQLVYVCGDVHGEWGRFNAFINSIRQSKKVRALAEEYDTLEAVVLQCGDFDFWPHTDPVHSWFAPGDSRDDGNRYAVKTDAEFLRYGQIKIYWCDGNHENHDALEAMEAEHPDEVFIPVMPGVFFASFGSVLTLLDGTTVMFCGGAESGRFDIQARTPGFSWWPHEGIDDDDMARLPESKTTPVDWIISHTGPHAFKVSGKAVDSEKNRQPSRERLDGILRAYSPKRWWFGHYHTSCEGWNMGCHWMTLDYLGNQYGRKWVDTVLLTKEE